MVQSNVPLGPGQPLSEPFFVDKVYMVRSHHSVHDLRNSGSVLNTESINTI